MENSTHIAQAIVCALTILLIFVYFTNTHTHAMLFVCVSTKFDQLFILFLIGTEIFVESKIGLHLKKKETKHFLGEEFCFGQNIESNKVTMYISQSNVKKIYFFFNFSTGQVITAWILIEQKTHALWWRWWRCTVKKMLFKWSARCPFLINSNENVLHNAPRVWPNLSLLWFVLFFF